MPPFDYEAFSNGVRGMPRAMVGDYIRLLCAMYDAGGAIENDPEKLRHALVCEKRPEAAKRVAALISTGKIHIGGDGLLHNRRTDEETAMLRRRPALPPHSASTAPAVREQCASSKPKKPTKTANGSAQKPGKSPTPDKERFHTSKETNPTPRSEIPVGISSPPAQARSTDFDSKRDVQPEPKEKPAPAVEEFHLEAEPDPERLTSGKGAKQDEKGFRRALAHLCLDPEIIDNLIIAKRNRRAPITALVGRQLASNLLACGTGNVEEAALLMIEKGWQTMKPEYFQRENARYGPPNGSPRPKMMIDEHVEYMRRKYGGQDNRPTADADGFDGYFQKLAASGGK